MEIINQRYQQLITVKVFLQKIFLGILPTNIYTNIVAKNLILELYTRWQRSRLGPRAQGEYREVFTNDGR